MKQIARRHLCFEIRMLRETASGLQGGDISPKAIRNALLESFLIHYRNLYDFLFPDYPRRRRLRDDVLATDFLNRSGKSQAIRPEWLRHYAQHRARVNTQLAHLSYKRLKYDSRTWPEQKMAHRIEKALEQFLADLPREKRRWFRGALQNPKSQSASDPPATPTPAVPALKVRAVLRKAMPAPATARVAPQQPASQAGTTHHRKHQQTRPKHRAA